MLVQYNTIHVYSLKSSGMRFQVERRIKYGEFRFQLNIKTLKDDRPSFSQLKARRAWLDKQMFLILVFELTSKKLIL